MRKIVNIVLISLGVLLLVKGCGKQEAATQTLKVGTDATYAPFGFQDEKTKEYVGFDIDLIKAVAKQAGFAVELTI